jgi:hypothetical protein
MKLGTLTLREYLTGDWNNQFKPQLKRAVLEIDFIWATAEAKRAGIPYTPLYWNQISNGKWLYSLWELK